MEVNHKNLGSFWKIDIFFVEAQLEENWYDKYRDSLKFKVVFSFKYRGQARE